MQKLVDSYKQSKNLHHAYFLVGDVDEIFSKLKVFLEREVQVKISGNPDFWSAKFDSLTIDEARVISESTERKSFESNPLTSSGSPASPARKIFIILADFITEEAQNALLKVFEEPTVGTHFFIISPQDILLPTLRSRMQIIGCESLDGEDVKVDLILGLKLKDRLAKVKEITDGISDEENTKQDAISFLNQIERELYEKGVEKSAQSLKICESARASLYDRGAPIKMILENVVLLV